jgi:hypothetical protein
MTPKQNNHPFALALFSLLGALFVGHAIYHYFILPEQVATHFRFSGEPDAWGPKTVFFLWYFIITGFCIAMFVVVNRALRPGHLSWLNIPEKEYWLSPERIHDTLKYVRSGILLFGSGTLLFVLDFVNQSFQVSLGNASKLDHPLTTFATYLFFCVLWVISLYRRFSRRG